MTADISKLRRKRTIKRNSAIQVAVVDELLAEVNRNELLCRLESLQESRAIVKELDDKILDLIEDEDEAEKSEKEALSHNLKIGIAMKKIENFLKELEKGDSRSRVGHGFTSDAHGSGLGEETKHMGVKLPKIRIKSFDGEISEWKSFIDTFDKKDSLTNI